VQAGDGGLGETGIPQPADEPRPLGLRGDDPQIGEVAAGQHGPANVQVDGVGKGHHDMPGARRRVAGRPGRIGGDQAVDARRHRVRKSLGAGVHPVDFERQFREQLRGGPADVAGAIEEQRRQIRAQGFGIPAGGKDRTARPDAGHGVAYQPAQRQRPVVPFVFAMMDEFHRRTGLKRAQRHDFRQVLAHT